MTRAAFGSVVTIALLLPVAWIASDQSISVPIPSELPIATDGWIVIGIPELIFVGVPTLFTLFMIVEATGHVRERKPPS